MPTEPGDWGSVAASLDAAGSALASATANRATRKWNEKMYDRQRKDAIDDWTRMNDYNSPVSQMKRLREAGLNPHMAGMSGNWGSATSMPHDASTGSFDAKPVRADIMAPFQGYYDIQMREAQLDNLKASNTVKEQDAILRAAQVLNTTASTETKKFDLGFKNELRETSSDIIKANLQQKLAGVESTKAGTLVKLDANERAAAMQAPNLLIAAEKVLNMRMQRSVSEVQKSLLRQQIENLQRDSTLKQMDIALKEKGIQPSDNMFMRILARYLDNAGYNMPKRTTPEVRGRYDTHRKAMLKNAPQGLGKFPWD